MKYKVKVGEEFDLYEMPAQTGNHDVVVHVNVGSPTMGKKSPPTWTIGLVVFGIFCALVVAPATAYGMATGDFSFLQAIAKNFNDLAAAVTKAALVSLDKK